MIAAMCYFVYAIYYIAIRVGIYGYRIPVWNIITWITFLGMAVTTFMKNKKAFAAVVGVNVLRIMYYIIQDFDLLYFWDFLPFAAYAIIMALIILGMKGKSVVRKIWFVPAIVILSDAICDWTRYRYFQDSRWDDILFESFEIAAVLFAGMWLKKAAAHEDTAKPATNYEP